MGLLNWLSRPGLVNCRRGIACGLARTDLRHALLTGVASLLFATSVAVAADADTQNQATGPAAAIIDKYVQATQTHEDALRGASMQVDINADVPKLQEHGRLRALRKISRVGQITYHVLSFQGDNTVKSQVIARYLQAEQQSQGDQSLALTPANYKFKYKGEKQTDTGQEVYVFQLSPHKKKVGLFKGEMWLDPKTYLPVFEKGRFVKNPSIFFKKVDFERAFTIQDGLAVPQSTSSIIDVRLIGKVKLDINYSNFEQNTDADDDTDGTQSAGIPKPPAK
jgi:hypothetical protein